MFLLYSMSIMTVPRTDHHNKYITEHSNSLMGLFRNNSSSRASSNLKFLGYISLKQLRFIFLFSTYNCNPQKLHYDFLWLHLSTKLFFCYSSSIFFYLFVFDKQNSVLSRVKFSSDNNLLWILKLFI